MRVLITGGYGFVGSFIAERFIKEDHYVTLLDDLSTGNKDNIRLNEHSYIMNVADQSCKKVFEDNAFDLVIHAANYCDANEERDLVCETSTNIVGLKNMLNLSCEYKVKQFIFLSSYDVYGDHGFTAIKEDDELYPINDVGRDYVMRETICKEFRDKGLNTKVLRLSNVYGPRLIHKTNIISEMIINRLNGIKGLLYEKETTLEDYIYVEDVADAVLRVSQDNTHTVYNISANDTVANLLVEETVNQACDMQGLKEEDTKVFENNTYSFRMDNANIYLLGFEPKYDLKNGVIKSLSWYINNKQYFIEDKKPIFNEKKEQNIKIRGKKVIDTLTFFALFSVVTLLLNKVVGINIDLMIIYVAVVAGVYGFGSGLLAGTLAIAYSIATHMLWRTEGVILTIESVSKYATYLLVGGFVGYFITKLKNRQKGLAEETEKATNQLHHVEDLYDKSMKIKKELQYNIETYNDSFGLVFDISKRLNKIDINEIYNEAVEIIYDLLKAKSVHIMYVEENYTYARTMASLGDKKKIQNSLKIQDYNFIHHAVNYQKMYINREMDEGTPMLTVPIISDNLVIGVVVIDEIEFDYLTLHYINIIKVVMMLISNAVLRANDYERAIQDKKYFTNTYILKNRWFEKQVEIRQRSKRRKLSNWAVLSTKDKIENLEEFYDKVNYMFRNIDCIGENNRGKLSFIFLNADDSNVDSIKERFLEQGIELE